MKSSKPDATAPEESCCADASSPAQTRAVNSAAETQHAFGALMRSARAAGALNERTKELILFSLVVLSRCESCFDVHYRKAREMGIVQAELDEAAWCAVAMGGSPVRMFYQDCLERTPPGETGKKR